MTPSVAQNPGVPPITESSTIPELISSLKLSFLSREFADVESILTSREELLKSELQTLTTENEHLRMDRGLVQKHADREKASLEAKLESLANERDELRDRVLYLELKVDRLKEKKGEYSRRYTALSEQFNRLEEEKKKLINDVNEANRKIARFQGTFTYWNDRLTELEEKVAEARGVDPSVVRREALELSEGTEDDDGIHFNVTAGEIRRFGLSPFLPKDGGNEESVVQTNENAADGDDRMGTSRAAPNPANVDVGKGPRNRFPIQDQSSLFGSGCSAIASLSPVAVTKNHGSVPVIEIESDDDDDVPLASKDCATQKNKGSSEVAHVVLEGNSCSDHATEMCHIGSTHSLSKGKKRISDGQNDESNSRGRLKTEHVGKSICERKMANVNERTAAPSSKNSPFFIKPCEEKARVQSSSQVPRRNFLMETDFTLSDGSTDSEECSAADIENELTRLRKRWNFKTMLSAFENDPVVCMNAVCALYRQKMSSSKFSTSEAQGFDQSDTTRATHLAEYLIDGHPELKLKRSLLEVQKQRPDVLNKCKELVSRYSEQIFEIYCKKQDPFFRPIT